MKKLLLILLILLFFSCSYENRIRHLEKHFENNNYFQILTVFHIKNKQTYIVLNFVDIQNDYPKSFILIFSRQEIARMIDEKNPMISNLGKNIYVKIFFGKKTYKY